MKESEVWLRTAPINYANIYTVLKHANLRGRRIEVEGCSCLRSALARIVVVVLSVGELRAGSVPAGCLTRTR